MNLKKPALLSLLLAGACLAQSAGAQHIAESKDSAEAKPSPDRLYFDAVKARMKGEDKESEALLKQVIAIKPGEAAPYYDLSKLSLKHNEAEKATEYIKKAIALDGSNKWYHEQYANALTLRNDYNGAADEYAGLAKSQHFNEQYLERSALLYQRAGKYKESLAQLQALHKRNPDDEDVLLQEQQIYLKMNDVDGAARTVRELIADNPKEPRFYGMLIEIYDNNKQPEKAKEALAEMNKRFPSDPSLQIAQATAALKKGDTASYREYLRKAVVNKDLDAETQIGLLRGYLGDLPDTVRRREAAGITEEILAQHPENVGLLSFYGYVLGLNGQREGAAQQFKKAVSLKKDDFGLWQQLLYSYTDRQSADSLIKWSEKAARIFPNQATVHFLNGVGHNNKKEYAAAIQSIERGIDLEPEEKAEELSEMLTALGDIYNTTKQYARSDSSYNAALRLNPRNATVLNNYAYYLSVRNARLDDAAKMSQESLKIRPGEGTFMDTYGWILYQQGKYKEALPYIQKAVDYNPAETDPTLFEHLGAVQYRLGNKDAAVDAWQKAKARGSENAAIDKMIAERKLYE